MAGDHDPDARLDRLLGAYRVRIDTGEDAVRDMVRAARLRAGRMRNDFGERGFLNLVAATLGIRRTAPLVWSALGGMTIALLMGVSLGVSDDLPGVDAQAFSVDFDAVLGTGAVSAGQDAAL